MRYEPFLHIVLHQPEIPQNTGNIGRTCVAVGAKLWLVRPLGFRLDARHLRRAGMDYWDQLEWEAVDGWSDLVERLGRRQVGWDCVPTRSGPSPNLRQGMPDRSTPPENGIERLAPRPLWFFSKTASRRYTDAPYRAGDGLVFGSETQGLPPSLLQADPDRVLRIPMRPEARSLNLASAVAIAAYEALRQLESVPGANDRCVLAAAGS